MQRDSGEDGIRDSLARFPWLTLAVVGIAALLSSSPAAEQALEYERDRVARGEVWLLITSQAVHWSARMALLDVGAVLLLGSWIEWRSRNLFVLTVAATLLLVAFGIHFAAPGYTHYRGASGLASGLFTAVALALAVRPSRGLPRILALAALALFATKLALEATTGRALFAGEMAPGVEALPLVHLLGAVAGAASFLVWRVRRRSV